MEVIGIVIAAAILVEAIVNGIKPIWDAEKRKVSYGALASLVIALTVSFGAGLDFPAVLGVPIAWSILPQIISGVIISRGANFIYDIMSKVKGE